MDDDAPRRPAPTEAQLSSWLAAALGEPALRIERGALPDGVGHSSETLALELVRPDGSSVAVIVRMAPTGPAVFPTYDLAVQVAALRAVSASSDAPVPEVLAVDVQGAALGRPLYVMERVVGEVPADRIPYTMTGWLYEADAEVRSRVWETTLAAMACVHRGQYTEDELRPLDRASHGTRGIRQQLQWWEGYAQWVCRVDGDATIDAATAWLHRHVPADPPPTSLLWGDARLSNALYRDGTAVALLDWEMAGLGPAEIDLAWFLYFDDFFSDGLGVPHLEGIPSRAASIARYEELLGRSVADLTWYEVFAAWRHSAVMARLADLWVLDGSIPADGNARHNNPASRMLAAMLDLPAPGAPGGPMG
jgi:aminoglycoside phosphotransferase (APT) family kinase protein